MKFPFARHPWVSQVHPCPKPPYLPGPQSDPPARCLEHPGDCRILWEEGWGSAHPCSCLLPHQEQPNPGDRVQRRTGQGSVVLAWFFTTAQPQAATATSGLLPPSGGSRPLLLSSQWGLYPYLLLGNQSATFACLLTLQSLALQDLELQGMLDWVSPCSYSPSNPGETLDSPLLPGDSRSPQAADLGPSSPSRFSWSLCGGSKVRAPTARSPHPTVSWSFPGTCCILNNSHGAVTIIPQNKPECALPSIPEHCILFCCVVSAG